MNLLEQKSDQKLNLYDIDFNYIKDNKTTKNKSDISNKDDSSFFIKNVNNAEANCFDKIYSNFFLFDINNISSNFNLNERYKEKKIFEKMLKNSGNLKKYNKRKNNSYILFNGNNKYYKINIPNSNKNDVGERLYNNSYLIQSKLENKRKLIDDNLKKNVIPKITKKAQKIKGDKTRLYNDNIIKKMRMAISQKSLLEKDKNCSFRPKLDKKSLQIAGRLEPSTSRLNKKKLKINKDEIFELTKESYSNLIDNHIINKLKKRNNKNLNRSTGDINKRINDFYQKQMEKIKEKEKKYNENKLKKEKEYQKYSFHPIINRKKNNIYLNKMNNNVNIFERLYKVNKTRKNKIHFDELKTITNEICTFRPEISPLNIKDDKKIIMSNIIPSNIYIQKRRSNIEKQKDFMEFKNKKFGNIYGLFKPAIVNKDNGLRTEKRFNSKNEKSLKKEDSNKYIITKGTVDFNETNSNMEGKIYYYLNDESNDTNIKIIKYNNVKHDLNQKEFLNAVNVLHKQIGNLNI